MSAADAPVAGLAVDPTAVLSVRGLRVSFGDHVVLERLDLDVAEHECVVLLGASGSGKSTLLRAVDLLEEVDDGVVALRGVDVTDPRVDADTVRARLGLVFQAYNLFDHLTLLDNLTLAPRLVHRRPRAEAEADAVAMLDRVGLAGREGAYPGQLSGGQQQRAAIARALLTGPDLLLLDEVTSALDPALVGEVLDILASVRATGTTMLVATHELGFARRVADRVCFLHAGRVWESGPPSIIDDPGTPELAAYLGG
ncbi:MAG TPA: amino acid ABC transporter ATP-binding protein [Actinotalea caeni]|uniref:amino acid ABC transporter ATP-binding protein n=1 Tax=Actinotalea caeni TaxID=1348467 RepID=UPI0012E2FE55|nr:amino acid ABC transporter ATP-binding protein [Actinotalea caeni]HLV55764.1 amino acid ABC transporter ATP-binding protein [Actinotalea caeni]